MRRILHTILSLLFVFTGACLAETSPLIIVKNSQPRATIVMRDSPGETTKDAAVALQRWIEEITGAVIPICKESLAPTKGIRILVGPSSLAKAVGATYRQDEKGPDGYVIKSFDGGVALVGNDAGGLCGSKYAVYDLLWRLGCGWYGVDPVWWVIPKRRTLSISPVNVTETPDFDMRDIWMVEQWKSGSDFLADAWRLNGRRVNFGHAFFRMLPKKILGKEHPDWFGKKQPDMTNPGVIQHTVKYFRRILDETPGWVTLSMTANDANGYIEKPYAAKVGNISAQNLYFCNAVARELRKTHPGRFMISMLAYYCTNEPPNPPLKAEPEVCVMFTNHGDRTRRWPEGKRNKKMADYFQKWKKTGAILGIYDYWIPGWGRSEAAWRRIPWYPGQVGTDTQRYWKKNGVKYITYESGYESKAWPLRWPMYYVGARGLWNTKVTSSQIMRKACEQLYGPAADDMFNFYRTIETAARNAGVKNLWHGIRLVSPTKIFTPEIEARVSGFLTAAAKKGSGNEQILARIRQEQKMWEGARETLAQLRSNPKTLYVQPVEWTPIYYNGRISYSRIKKIDLPQLRRIFNIPEDITVYKMNNNGERDPFTKDTRKVDPRRYWFISPQVKP